MKEKDFTNITKQTIFDKYTDYIVLDMRGDHYIHIKYAVEIMDVNRPYLYKLIDDEKLYAKSFGGAKFIKMDTLLKEVKNKKRKQKFNRKQLMQLSDEEFDKIYQEEMDKRIKQMNPERIKEYIKNSLTIEQIEKLLQDKKKSKK